MKKISVLKRFSEDMLRDSVQAGILPVTTERDIRICKDFEKLRENDFKKLDCYRFIAKREKLSMRRVQDIITYMNN